MIMTENTELALTFAPTPLAVLASDKAYSEFYERMKAELAAFKPDTTTATGRKAIASMAFKVTRTKTAIDEAGKQLNAEARAKIDAVDASRRKVRAELDALAEETRKPLTDWEAAEAARIERMNTVKEQLRRVTSLAQITTNRHELEAEAAALPSHYDAATYGDHLPIYQQMHDDATQAIEAGIARIDKAEADAAELARLRAEQHEREAQAFAAAEIARINAETAEREAEAAEAARLEEERKKATEIAERQAEEDRQAEHRRSMALAAEQAAAEAKRQAEEKHAAELKAEQDKREELERQAKARQEAIDKEQREQAARDRDRKHRGEVMKAAKEAIMSIGGSIPEDIAKALVLAIVAGEIPNVTLKF